MIQLKFLFAEPREVVVREGCAWMVLGRWVDFDAFFILFLLSLLLLIVSLVSCQLKTQSLGKGNWKLKLCA